MKHRQYFEKQTSYMNYFMLQGHLLLQYCTTRQNKPNLMNYKNNEDVYSMRFSRADSGDKMWRECVPFTFWRGYLPEKISMNSVAAKASIRMPTAFHVAWQVISTKIIRYQINILEGRDSHIFLKSFSHLKILDPRRWNEASSILSIHKYQGPPYQIWSPQRPGTWDLCTPTVSSETYA